MCLRFCELKTSYDEDLVFCWLDFVGVSMSAWTDGKSRRQDKVMPVQRIITNVPTYSDYSLDSALVCMLVFTWLPTVEGYNTRSVKCCVLTCIHIGQE